MIYFSMGEIFRAVFAFSILGFFASFLYFFLSFIKKEGLLNLNMLKAVLVSSPKEYNRVENENKPASVSPPGNFFEFAYTLFVGLIFILTSYLFADGLIRLAYLFFFTISFLFTGKLLLRIEEPLLSVIAKITAKILYLILLIIYPLRRAVGVIIKMIFCIVRNFMTTVFKFFKKNVNKYGL